jgi:hypothetical protein
MGFRFSRRLTILPGVHVNLSAKGASLSVGPRGASVNVGRTGVHANVGLPGTGLSYRTRIAAPPPRSAASEHPATSRDEILAALADEAEAYDPRLDQVHLDTPRPSQRPAFRLPRPEGDVAALMAWRAAKANYENGLASDPEVTGDLVEQQLQGLQWSRRTQVAFRVDDAGRSVTIDVDLPEIEDMPTSEIAVDRRALRLVERPLTAKRRNDVYAMHVAGVAFRLVGAVFAAAPGVCSVRLSAYTTRAVGGVTSDDYVAAGEVQRSDWAALSQADFASLDVEIAVRRLGIRMERTGRGALATVPPCS